MTGNFFEDCFDNVVDIWGAITGWIAERIDRLKHLKMHCPRKGGFVGFKQCVYYESPARLRKCLCVVELWIPPVARRSSGTDGGKGRASMAKVIGLQTCSGVDLPPDTIAYSAFDDQFEYKLGKWVFPDSFDDNRWNECSNGIHFFMTREEAADYWSL